MERQPMLSIWKPVAEFAEEFGRVIKINLKVEPKTGLVITLIDIRKMEVDFIYDKGVAIMGDGVMSFRYTTEIPFSGLEFPQDKNRDFPNEGVWDPRGFHLLKATDSDYLDRFKRFFPDELAQRLEHHIYPVDTGIIEVICDYEPKIVLSKSAHKP